MKAKIFKMVLPAFILMLAVFGAFAFKNADNKALLAPETGWINLPGQPCFLEVSCDDALSPFVCTTIHNGVTRQAFGKENPQSMVCDKVLYRVP